MANEALARLLEIKGLSINDLPKKSEIRGAMRRRGVRTSSTIGRVLAIPRRDPAAFAPEAIELLSERYGYGTQTLRDLQAVTLCEVYDYGGGFAPMGTGTGKTLVTLLAPVLLEAKRPVLLTRASLRDKTFAEILDIGKHWMIPQLIRADKITTHPGDGAIAVMSYEWLSTVQGAEALEKLDPDFIAADEAHKLRNNKSACTKRFKRHVVNHRPRILILSGTIMSRSILDFCHLIGLALPDMNPTPEHFPEQLEWALALDTKVEASDRMGPGALVALFNEEEKIKAVVDETEAARSAFRRRLVDTPGIVASGEEELGVGLEITTVDPWGDDPQLDAPFRTLRSKWELPDGQSIPDPPSFRRHAIEMSLGFWYRWKEQPPIAWRERRRAWHTLVRDILANNRRNLDSEKQVALALVKGEYDDKTNEVGMPAPKVYAEWQEIKPTFVPETEVVWISDKMITYISDWAKENVGLIWVTHVLFARELADRTGLPYYGAGGIDLKTKRGITEADPSKSMVLSIGSNSEGRNLQAWCKNLFVDIPKSGKVVEQCFARSHRPGQEADTVTVLIMTGCTEALASFQQARADARGVESVTGARQKLCYADITQGNIGSGPRWA